MIFALFAKIAKTNRIRNFTVYSIQLWVPKAAKLYMHTCTSCVFISCMHVVSSSPTLCILLTASWFCRNSFIGQKEEWRGLNSSSLRCTHLINNRTKFAKKVSFADKIRLTYYHRMNIASVSQEWIMVRWCHWQHVNKVVLLRVRHFWKHRANFTISFSQCHANYFW